MTSLAENSWKELEIALNEQNLVSNSFMSTIIELKQSGNFWIQGVHLKLRKTNCLLQWFFGGYMGQNIWQNLLMHWTL